MVNSLMSLLLDDAERIEILRDLSVRPKRVQVERPPSSVFKVVACAPNLRRVVNSLLVDGKISGFRLNRALSLSDVVADKVATGDYLTLLVHVGVLLVHRIDGNDVFKCASGAYQQMHLEPLCKILKSSLGTLMLCKNAHEVYAAGEDLFLEFLSTRPFRNEYEVAC